ncbi:LysR family transcriptional regulator [Plantactinospora endophytica]|uniref:LysR family transcriptional regulator n=1 Tax=Plantactinospora endophytica TaxID=673535 RepID=A0ABQ4DVB4_9ACTN|nr:LysR family transcriptional regulator [Plantactinospora endophytica]GIG86374.1 LysR family transcriptional regulator [Plantactinospora endophytica]
MLDVRRLQVLRAVVTSGSVTAAARGLGYTPSAVSQQMAALEKEAGIALLERTGRGVRPTEAGRVLTEHAAEIDRHVAEAESALADLRAGRAGRVTVGYFATAGAALVAPALAELRRDHPGVRVELRLTDPEDPLLEVRAGRADLALVVRPPDRPPVDGIRFLRLCDDGYRAVLPARHPLASRRVLDLAELAGEPWVGSEWPGPCLDTILDACASAGFRPEFAVQSEDYATAQGFVAAGLGVSLVPELGLGNRHPAVAVRRVRNPEPVRAIYAAIRESAPAQPAVHGLLDALRRAAAPEPATS